MRKKVSKAVIRECLLNVATSSLARERKLTCAELNSGSFPKASRDRRRAVKKERRGGGEGEPRKIDGHAKDEAGRIVQADPPILPRLTTLNTNRGTWHEILGMRQNARCAGRKSGRAGEEGSANAGYFSPVETNALRARKFQSPPLRRKWVDFSN